MFVFIYTYKKKTLENQGLLNKYLISVSYYGAVNKFVVTNPVACVVIKLPSNNHTSVDAVVVEAATAVSLNVVPVAIIALVVLAANIIAPSPFVGDTNNLSPVATIVGSAINNFEAKWKSSYPAVGVPVKSEA